MSLKEDRMSKENQDNGFYSRNLSILEKRRELSLVEKIEKAKFSPSIQVISTKVGLPTVKIGENGNRATLIHSAYDPVKEAKNFISGYELEEARFVTVLGFGLGYHVKEVLESYPQLKLVIVIEPNISLFKTALKVLDLSVILSSPKVKLIIEDEPSRIEREMLGLATFFLIHNNSMIVHKPSFNLLKEELTQIRKSINKTVFWCTANLTTNIVKGDTFQRNILTNISQIINNAGVKNLFDKFLHQPVICVAAGPSLDKNIHLLEEAKNKALIICVDAALRTMLQHKIRPDLVVSIDYSEGTRNLFDEVMEQTENLFLAADPEIFPGVLSDFKGRKFIINLNKPLTHWLSKLVTDKGTLDKGASVAHAAFSLARAMGADPIILVGQDLSFPGGVTHVEGAVPRANIAIGRDKKTGKKYLLQKTKDGKYKANDLIMVKDIYGKEVPTRGDMYSYLIYFEKLISMTKAKCIDATEGGARIKGTEVMSLREVIDRYCRERIEVREILEQAAKDKEEINLGKLKEEMEEVIVKLKEIHFYAGQGQEIMKKLYREVKQSYSNRQRIEALVKESNQLKDKITRTEPHIRSFLEQEMYSYLYLVERKKNLRLDKFSRRKKLITQIEKVAIFYDGVKKATNQLIGDFQLSLSELRKGQVSLNCPI